VTAKLERGGERRYEFSGPLGEKIKESLQEDASAESLLVPAEHLQEYQYHEHRERDIERERNHLRSSRRHFESLSLSEGVNPMARTRRGSLPTFSSSSAYISSSSFAPVPLDQSRDQDRDSVSVSPLSMHLSPAPEPSRTQDKRDSSQGQGLYQGRATFPLSNLPQAGAPRMRPHTEPGQSPFIPAETVLFHKAPRLAAYDRPERTASAVPVRTTAPVGAKVNLTQ
jgi:hypothetical protein